VSHDASIVVALLSIHPSLLWLCHSGFRCEVVFTRLSRICNTLS